jgi:polyisoprenoid-binding protein YceI
VQVRPGTWNVDALHSQLIVSVRHMALAKLRAKFPKLTGRLEIDATDPLRSSFELAVDTGSVTTGHAPQEDFMRSEPWLDAEHHPAITFRSIAVEPRGGSAYAVRGELTMKGVTREIEILGDFFGVNSDPWGLRAAFIANLTIDRRDFGITWNREFDWGLMAGWELEVALDLELGYPDEALAQKPRA